MGSLMDLIPLIGGGLFGAIFKMISINMDNKRIQQEMIINLSSKKQEHVDKANEMASKNEWFAWTRRVIALSLTAMIGSLLIIPLYNPDVPINIMNTASDGASYLFGLIDTRTTKEIWVELKGIVVLPVVQDAFLAVIGTYFGSSLISTSRR